MQRQTKPGHYRSTSATPRSDPWKRHHLTLRVTWESTLISILHLPNLLLIRVLLLLLLRALLLRALLLRALLLRALLLYLQFQAAQFCQPRS
jgi:hypothetical protein